MLDTITQRVVSAGGSTALTFDSNACPKLPAAQIRDVAALRKDLGVLVNRHIRRRDALENILAGRLRALISSATGWTPEPTRFPTALPEEGAESAAHVHSVRAHLADVGPVGPRSGTGSGSVRLGTGSIC